MSTSFEMPRLRTLARHALPNVVEGSLVPVGLFMVVLHFFGLWGAMAAGLGWSYAAVLRRVVSRQRVPGLLVIGTVTLTARSILAFATGSSVLYFLQPTLGTAVAGVVILASAMFGQPLVLRIARDFCPFPSDAMEDAHFRRFFLGISLLWGVAQLLNAVVTFWLLVSQSVGTYVVARTAMSWTLTGVAIAITVAWFTHVARHRREHALRTVTVSA